MTLEDYVEQHLGWIYRVSADELIAQLRADGFRIVKLVEQTNEHGVLLSMAVAEELS